MKKALLIIFWFLLYLPCSAQEATRGISILADSIRVQYEIPGMAVAVIKPDTCYLGISGTAKTGGTDTLSLKNKFHLGSNTKAVTSFIAMKMVEEGKIRLTTKLVELIPDLSNAILKEYQNITLGDLLSHNAGIQPYTGGLEFLKLPKLEGSVSDKRRAFTEFVLNETPVKKGTYSNAGYVIASLMLEKTSGKTFEQLLEKTMDDLGLEYYIGFPNKGDISNPWGHRLGEGSLIALRPTHPYKLQDVLVSAGDLSMNILDYSVFIQMHLNGLLGESNYLKSSSYEKLHFGIKNYSYGWGNAMNEGNKISYHDGSTGTYYCHTILIPAKKIAVVVMINSAARNQVEGIYALRKLLVKKYGTKL